MTASFRPGLNPVMASSARLANRVSVNRVVALRINLKGAQCCTLHRGSPAPCARPPQSQFWGTALQITARELNAPPAAIEYLDAAHVQEIQNMQEKTEFQVSLKQKEVELKQKEVELKQKEVELKQKEVELKQEQLEKLEIQYDTKKAQVDYMNGVLNGRGLIEKYESRKKVFKIPREKKTGKKITREEEWNNLVDPKLLSALKNCCKEQQSVGQLMQYSYENLSDKTHNYNGIEQLPGEKYALPVSSLLPVSVQCVLQVLMKLEYGFAVPLLVRGEGEPDDFPAADVDA